MSAAVVSASAPSDAPIHASLAQGAPSAGLWTQAWRKLTRDRVAIGAAVVMLLYLAVVLGSATGLIASNWGDEVAVNYAPPSFAKDWTAPRTVDGAVDPTAAAGEAPDNELDPLLDDLKALKAERASKASIAAIRNDGIAVQDPLADWLQDIAAKLGAQQAAMQAVKADSLPMGADKWGRDVLSKTLKGAETSFVVGLFAALVATLIGTLLGALAGYFGGRTDAALNWVYSVFTSVPYLLLILAVAAVLQKKGVGTIVFILGLTGWTGVFRLIRGETMKHKVREYVRAAEAIGASHTNRIFKHIFPNISHVMLVQMSILTVGFIKSEVILSFLGFGVPVDSVSWGSMLNEAQNELLLGYWWQMLAASVAMAGLVTAFSLFTDALRDALDPKLK